MLRALHALHFEQTPNALRLPGYHVFNCMFLQILKNKGPEERMVAEKTTRALWSPVSGVPNVVTHLITATVARQATPVPDMETEACRRHKRLHASADRRWTQARVARGPRWQGEVWLLSGVPLWFFRA